MPIIDNTMVDEPYRTLMLRNVANLQTWPGANHVVSAQSGEFQGFSVRYCEMEGFPTAAFEQDNCRAVITYLIYWSDLQKFRMQVLGYPYVVGEDLYRWLPHTPLHDGLLNIDNAPFLFASRIIGVKGEGYFGRDILGCAVYLYAFVTVQYDSVFYPVLFRSDVTEEHQRFCFKHNTASARAIVVNRGTMVWDDPLLPAAGADVDGTKNGDPVAYGLNVIEPQGEAEWTWYDVPSAAFNRARLINFAGTVNQSMFDGYSAETLLLTSPPEIVPRKSTAGVITHEIKLKFSVCGGVYDGVQRTHNKVRAADNKFYSIKVGGLGGTTRRLFEANDFTQLFRP